MLELPESEERPLATPSFLHPPSSLRIGSAVATVSVRPCVTTTWTVKFHLSDHRVSASVSSLLHLRSPLHASSKRLLLRFFEHSQDWTACDRQQDRCTVTWIQSTQILQPRIASLPFLGKDRAVACWFQLDWDRILRGSIHQQSVRWSSAAHVLRDEAFCLCEASLSSCWQSHSKARHQHGGHAISECATQLTLCWLKSGSALCAALFVKKQPPATVSWKVGIVDVISQADDSYFRSFGRACDFPACFAVACCRPLAFPP